MRRSDKEASAMSLHDLATTESMILTCPLMPCWVMKVFRAPVSEFWG